MLKLTPDFSNTDALAEKTAKQFSELGIDTEIIRLNDYLVLTGNTSDGG